MDKRNIEKIKENLPEMGNFTRRYLTETLSAAALIIGSFSAWKGFFFGGPFATLLCLAVCAILGIFFPNQIDAGLKKAAASFNTKNRINEIVFGAIMIGVSLFVPFVYFGLIGLLAGCAYHHYSQGSQSQNTQNKGNRAA